MKALGANAILWLSAAIIATYMATYLIVGAELSVLAVRFLLLVIAVIVGISWLPAAISAMRGGVRSAADKIVITVWGSWTLLICSSIYAVLNIVLEQPAWLTNSPALGIILTMFFMMGLYAAYATLSAEVLPKQEKVWLLISTFLGGTVMGAVATWIILVGM